MAEKTGGSTPRTRSGPHDVRRREVFSELFAEHYPTIVRYAERRVESRAVAEEIAAEVFAVAWDKLDQRNPFTLRWLYRTASNKVMNHWSRTRSRNEHERRLTRDEPASGYGAETLEILVLREALQRLPARQAEALRLTAWEGLSAPEIAEVFGCRVSAVHKMLSRGRIRLRELLAPETPPHPHALSGEEQFS